MGGTDRTQDSTKEERDGGGMDIGKKNAHIGGAIHACLVSAFRCTLYVLCGVVFWVLTCVFMSFCVIASNQGKTRRSTRTQKQHTRAGETRAQQILHFILLLLLFLLFFLFLVLVVAAVSVVHSPCVCVCVLFLLVFLLPLLYSLVLFVVLLLFLFWLFLLLFFSLVVNVQFTFPLAGCGPLLQALVGSNTIAKDRNKWAQKDTTQTWEVCRCHVPGAWMHTSGQGEGCMRLTL